MPMRGTRVVTIELADDISKELPPRNDMGVGSDNFTCFAWCLLPSRTDDDFVMAVVEVGWKASDCPAAAARRKIRKEESFIITARCVTSTNGESKANQLQLQYAIKDLFFLQLATSQHLPNVMNYRFHNIIHHKLVIHHNFLHGVGILRLLGS